MLLTVGAFVVGVLVGPELVGTFVEGGTHAPKLPPSEYRHIESPQQSALPWGVHSLHKATQFSSNPVGNQTAPSKHELALD